MIINTISIIKNENNDNNNNCTIMRNNNYIKNSYDSTINGLTIITIVIILLKTVKIVDKYNR